MYSSDILKKILGILKSRPNCALDDLMPALPERLRSRSQVLGSVVPLVRWGLVDVFQEKKRVPLDTLEKLTRFNLPNDLRVVFSQKAVEIEQALSISFEVTSIFGVPKKAVLDVFVVMPFAGALTPVFEQIKAAAQRLDLSVARGNDFFTIGSIMEDVWSAIHTARFIVADCTGRNPNVFYEIGIAHAIGKSTILVSQSMDDIPFDLRHLRILVYAPTPQGLEELGVALERTMLEIQIEPAQPEPSA